MVQNAIAALRVQYDLSCGALTVIGVISCEVAAAMQVEAWQLPGYTL
jgi:hypothetical protein